MKLIRVCRSISHKKAQNLFGDAFELDKAAQTSDHHSFFTLQTARQRGPVVQFVLPFHVIPNLAIRTLTIPAEVSVRDRIDGKVLKAAQETILLRDTDLVAHYFETDELLVRFEQIRSSFIKAVSGCTLFTHRQRQYNRSLLKFVY